MVLNCDNLSLGRTQQYLRLRRRKVIREARGFPDVTMVGSSIGINLAGLIAIHSGYAATFERRSRAECSRGKVLPEALERLVSLNIHIACPHGVFPSYDIFIPGLVVSENGENINDLVCVCCSVPRILISYFCRRSIARRAFRWLPHSDARRSALPIDVARRTTAPGTVTEFAGSIPVVPELHAASSEASEIPAIGIARRECSTKSISGKERRGGLSASNHRALRVPKDSASAVSPQTRASVRSRASAYLLHAI